MRQDALARSSVRARQSMSINAHLQRVSGYCALLAERLGMDADLMRVASRLHDVGMAAVTDAVVMKPGPLTPEERREMRDHAHLGYAMLAGSGVEPLETAAVIACTHHERWDGGGYPRGLAGEEIPLPGRITAVADTFDALTTWRVYHPTRSVDEAVEVLTNERGRQLDPAVVDAFVQVLDQALAIRDRHPSSSEDTLNAAAPADEDAQMTLQAAAATLAISPSRLRRWADEGRIPAIRTSGGHRRFPLQAVRRLAAERGLRPNVKPIEPPTTPLPVLAEHVQAHGRQMAAAAAAAVYHDGPPGWFASEHAGADLREWLEALAASCADGRYTGVLHASQTLMRRAHLHAASLLERHAFLERFGQVAVRALVRAGAKRTEIAATRRLFTSLQQALLDD
jgi:excisionase family DNA binding protein